MRYNALVDILRRISIPQLLLIGAAIELLLNRIAVRVVSTETTLYGIVDLCGLFAFYFTGLLSTIVLAWSTWISIRDRRSLLALNRVTVGTAALTFLPLAFWALLFGLPGRVQPYLNLSFGLMIASLVLCLAAQRVPLRAKLGLFYIAAPLLLHCYWLWTQQMPHIAPQGDYSDLPSRLFETGEQLLIVGAFAVFLFYAPFPRRMIFLEPVPVAFAAISTSLLASVAFNAYPLAAQAAYYGLGINFPSPSVGGLLHLAALFLFVLTVAALKQRPGLPRAQGFGLLAIALSGFELKLAYQFLLTCVGVMTLVRAGLAAGLAQHKPNRSPVGADDWKRYFELLASGLEASGSNGVPAETVVLQNGAIQVVRFRGMANKTPLELRVVVADGEIDELWVDLGELPRDALVAQAPATLLRTSQQRGRRWSTLRGSKASFLPEFALRDDSGEIATLLGGAELQQSMQRSIHGALGLWPKEGLQYRMRPLGGGWPIPLAELASAADRAPQEDLRHLIQTLRGVAGRLEVP